MPRAKSTPVRFFQPPSFRRAMAAHTLGRWARRRITTKRTMRAAATARAIRGPLYGMPRLGKPGWRRY